MSQEVAGMADRYYVQEISGVWCVVDPGETIVYRADRYVSPDDERPQRQRAEAVRARLERELKVGGGQA